MLNWNTTLEHLAECVPVLVDKQELQSEGLGFRVSSWFSGCFQYWILFRVHLTLPMRK